jgi:hypothetical protein
MGTATMVDSTRKLLRLDEQRLLQRVHRHVPVSATRSRGKSHQVTLFAELPRRTAGSTEMPPGVAHARLVFFLLVARLCASNGPGTLLP